MQRVYPAPKKTPFKVLRFGGKTIEGEFCPQFGLQRTYIQHSILYNLEGVCFLLLLADSG